MLPDAARGALPAARDRTTHSGYAPRSLIAPALVALAMLVLPLAALIGHVDGATFVSDVTSPQALQALSLSLVTAACASIVCVALGIPLAIVIARAGPRTAALLRAIVTIPLVLPPLVGGVALLMLLGRRGWWGGALAGLGIQLPFTTAAVVIAQTFVALPFLVLSVAGALGAAGIEHERTAAALGAGRWQVLWRITLPLAAPGIVAGVVLSFARALGEFGATALFAGNAPGTTQTMPLAIYTAFNGGGVTQNASLALSLLLLSAAVIVLVLVRGWRGDGGRPPRYAAAPSGPVSPRATPPHDTSAAATPTAAASGLAARIAVERPGFRLDVELEVAPGEALAIMGPSGAGKSTLLDAIAGLEPLAAGTITLSQRATARAAAAHDGPPIATDRVVLDDTATATHVAPHRRRVVSLRQSAGLFPHLDARANVAFALRQAPGPIPRGVELARAADAWLERVGLAGFGARRPAQLSGGQAQRVALARALAARPRILLLDEPFVSLDVETIGETRLVVRDAIAAAGVTTLLATHGIDDALALAHRIAIIEAGTIVAQGPTRDVLHTPATAFVAAVADLNRVSGAFEPDGTFRAGALRIAASGRPGARSTAVFPPSAVTLTAVAAPVAGDCRVASSETVLQGTRVRVHDPEMSVDAPGEARDWPRGTAVTLHVDAAAVRFLDTSPDRG